MLMKKAKSFIIYIIMIAVLLFSILAAYIIGSSDISFKSVLNVLQQKIFGKEFENMSASISYII